MIKHEINPHSVQLTIKKKNVLCAIPSPIYWSEHVVNLTPYMPIKLFFSEHLKKKYYIHPQNVSI